MYGTYHLLTLLQEPVEVSENEKEIRDKIYFYRAIDSDFESESDEDSDDDDERIVATRGKFWNLTNYIVIFEIHACMQQYSYI